MKVTMRATYDEVETFGPDNHREYGGYTDPRNPWGGFTYEIPDGLCGEPFVPWRNENAETIEFDNLIEAAEFVLDFPGGVWDYSESESELQSDGRWKRVTLHVEDHDVAVFELADMVEVWRRKGL